MDFIELKRHCETMHISTTSVAEEIGLSYEGLKKGFMNGSVGIRYVIPLCNALCISPNKLFGYKEDQSSIKQTAHGVGNTQIADMGISALQEQLKAKDEQINKLLNILSK